MAYDKPRRPSRFPAVVNFHRDQLTFDFYVVDELAFETFLMNVRNLDGPKLKAASSEKGSAGVTVDDLRGCLVDGQAFREKRPLETDGPKILCPRCAKPFQPIVIRFTNREGQPDEGGNFRSIKAEELKQLPADAQAAINALTAEIFSEAGVEVPTGLTTRVVAFCKECRDHEITVGIAKPWFYKTRAGSVDAAIGRDGIITSAIARKERLSAFDNAFKRPQQRFDNRGGDRRDQSGPRKDINVDWHGASVRPWTKEKLDALVSEGKVEADPGALAAMSEQEMIALGIARDEKSAQAVHTAMERAASKAVDREALQRVAGEATLNMGAAFPSEMRDDARRRTRKRR